MCTFFKKEYKLALYCYGLLHKMAKTKNYAARPCSASMAVVLAMWRTFFPRSVGLKILHLPSTTPKEETYKGSCCAHIQASTLQGETKDHRGVSFHAPFLTQSESKIVGGHALRIPCCRYVMFTSRARKQMWKLPDLSLLLFFYYYSLPWFSFSFWSYLYNTVSVFFWG